ncbi:DUF3378 domain-containing protein, partial [Candidatus Similichlamydia laticola]|uniref:DUF3378 domain-containing protein n=1 Tax=Candidatus Similichlamydia laticola TaxID=2170265 RepID=UPI000DF723E5
MSVRVIQVDSEKWAELEAFLLESGFNRKRKVPRVVFSLEKAGVSCCLYETGKCVIQGKDIVCREFIEFALEPFLGDFSYSS